MTNLNSIIFTVALGSTLLTLGSCAKEDAFEEPTLLLSDKSIIFSKNADEKSISITTNQPKWVASSPQEGEWLNLVQDGNNLRLKVGENSWGKERLSYVLVNANGATEKLEVRQSAADAVLNITPNALVMPQSGGTKVVDITTNVGSYDVTPEEDVDWLTISKHEEEIKLTATANKTSEMRSLKLFAKSGSEAREITLTQPGMQTYILPINPGPSYDVRKIMEFELERGSFLREYQAGNRSFGLDMSYTFVTPSPIFTLIQYSSSDGKTPSTIATVGDGKKAVEVCKDRAFERFLMQNGYQRVGNSSQEYVSTEALLALKVTISERAGNEGVSLVFTPIERQPQAYATFAALPYAPLELIQKTDKKLAEVEAFEKQNGGTEVSRRMNETYANEVTNVRFDMGNNNAPYYSRTYYFYNSDVKNKIPAAYLGSVESAVLLVENVNLGMWNNGANWYVTQELQALLSKEGFEKLNAKGKIHFFKRSKDQLKIAVTPIQDNGKPVLALLFSYDEATLVSTANRLLNQQ